MLLIFELRLKSVLSRVTLTSIAPASLLLMLFACDRVGRRLHKRHDKNTINTKNTTDIPDITPMICSIGMFLSFDVIDVDEYNGSPQLAPVKSGGQIHRNDPASFIHVAPLPHGIFSHSSTSICVK